MENWVDLTKCPWLTSKSDLTLTCPALCHTITNTLYVNTNKYNLISFVNDKVKFGLRHVSAISRYNMLMISRRNVLILDQQQITGVAYTRSLKQNWNKCCSRLEQSVTVWQYWKGLTAAVLCMTQRLQFQSHHHI